MSREYKVLSHLGPAWDKAPSPLLQHQDDELIGAPFYIMERLRGIILRRQLPAGLNYDEADARELSGGLIDTLAELHQLDYADMGLGELGKAEGYVRRQVEGWTKRYRKAQTDQHNAIESLAGWLDEQQPAESGVALIHNDYKYDNVVLDPKAPTKIVGVLDWEMCTLGDPLMDLGTTLGYWVQADDDPRAQFLAFGPTHIPGSLTRRQLVDRYQERTGREVERPLFYSAFGIFKIAVIIQQIYARFKAGKTRDPRFAPLGHMVGLLGELAAQQIDRDSLG
jgi:aminoglycoside phosphotransferase (APT) family kinase protein